MEPAGINDDPMAAERAIYLAEKTPPVPPTCQRCGWPLHDDVKDGCTADNCSQRPLPPLKDEVEGVPFPVSEHERQRRIPGKKEIFDAIENELMAAFNRQDGAVVVDLMRQMRSLLTR